MSDEKIAAGISEKIEFMSNSLHAMREKYWKEKTADEKIETLAGVLHSVNQQLRMLQERVGLLGVHTHSGPGSSPVVPLEKIRSDSEVSNYDYVGHRLGMLSPEHYR